MTKPKPHLGSLVPEVLKELLAEAQQAVSRTETQIGSFIGRLADKGSITREEAARFGASFKEQSKKNRENMSRFVDRRFERIISSFQIPSHAEVEGLRDRVRRLHQRVEAAANRIGR